MINRNQYSNTLSTLKTLEELQLIEMFYDIDDIERVQLIADSALYFIENYKKPEAEEESYKKSDWEDWKEMDDAQRYRDIKSVMTGGHY